MKQTVVVRQTRTMKLELEVIQPLAKATIEQVVNAMEGGMIGAPSAAVIVAREASLWQVAKAEPQCECPAEPAKARGKARRGR